MSPQSTFLSRFSRLLLWGAGWLASSIVVYLVAAGNLPDPVAIHWGPSGAPDGSAPSWAILLAAVGTSSIGLALAPVFTVGREPSVEAFALVGMSGGLALSLTSVTTFANYGLDDWTEAAEIGLLALVFIFAVPVLGLIGGLLLGRHWYPLKPIPRRVEDVEKLEIGEDERISWVGRARVRWIPLLILGVAFLLLLLVPSLPLWVFVLVAGVGIVFSQVEAQVTNDGLRVRLGGIPVRRIRLEDISSAQSIDADPAQLGGWGWRVVPGATAIVLRAGEAISVTFRNGRRFVITVDDAAIGAALINGLIDLSLPDPS